MEHLILKYLDDQFYYSAVHNCVFSINNDTHGIGYNQIEDILNNTFYLTKKQSYPIVVDWLLGLGVDVIDKNWNNIYIIHNHNATHWQPSITDNIDFEYKLILDGR